MSDHTPEEQRLLGPTYRAIFLFSLFFVCAFNFADRAIFAVLAQSIRVDLKLTDFAPGGAAAVLRRCSMRSWAFPSGAWPSTSVA